MKSEFLNSTQYSIAFLKQVHDGGQLVMKPPFQRNPVWTDSQKSYLIDTILHGYPVPEIYMQQDVDSAGRERHVVVDGQQRMRACLEFIEGKFEMNGEDSPEWAEQRFADLTEDERKRIYSYKFVVRTLPLVDDEVLRGIFRRLNRNVVALNAQELRHATYWGPFIKTMEKLSEYAVWDSLGVFTVNDTRRMLDVEYISELAMALLYGLQNKKVNLEKTYQLYEVRFDEASRVEETFTRVLGEVEKIFPDLRATRWRKKSDFYSLFLVLAEHRSALPLAAEKRQQAKELLCGFGEDVDASVALNGTRRKRVKKAVEKYAIAVERAASDLANRKARAEVLRDLLKPVFR